MLCIRNTQTGQTAAEHHVGLGHGVRIAYRSDGGGLLAWHDQFVRLLDPATGEETAHAAAPGRAYFTGLAVPPSGDWFLTVGGDGVARTWDARTLRQTHT